MKKQVAPIILIFLFSFLLLSCEKDSDSDLSGIYKVKLNETIAMPENGTGATVTLIEFVDHRCPPNFFCITSGISYVKLKFNDRRNEQTVQLCFEICDDKEAIIKLNGSQYLIHMDNIYEVNPPPTAKVNPMPVLSVSKIR